jgi:hypothetical protein
MEKNLEPAISSAKSTGKSISNDTNSEKENINSTPLYNVLSLVLLFLATLAIIYFGYVHGNMHLLTTLKNTHG